MVAVENLYNHQNVDILSIFISIQINIIYCYIYRCVKPKLFRHSYYTQPIENKSFGNKQCYTILTTIFHSLMKFKVHENFVILVSLRSTLKVYNRFV